MTGPPTVPHSGPQSPRLAAAMGTCALALIAVLAAAPAGEVSRADVQALRDGMSGLAAIPFVVLLLAIAVLPMVMPHRWERHRFKALVSLVLAIPVVALLAAQGAAGRHELFEKAREYVSFMCLIGSLFVLSGGVHLRGSLAGTPLANTLLLTIGALAASLVGTTGASVLLIRPFLRANASRRRRAHLVVFFIFVVANSGGL